MKNTQRLRVRLLILLAASVAVTGAVVPAAWSQECHRERWQKVDQIFEAMGVGAGATVADIGAGEGFFTTRLSTAVGPDGRVYAVDIAERQLQRLRQRVADDGIANVTVVEGAADDPRLPAGTLDAALIINAYHEMNEHQAMLAAIRRALKPDGRLVIVEPISDPRRTVSRAEQTRSHEIAPEHVMADAREAGFRIVALQDPFTTRVHEGGRGHDEDQEWLLVLQPLPAGVPSESAEAVPAAPGPKNSLDSPSLRMALDEFKARVADQAVTVVDVRGSGAFASGHIPGSLMIPLTGLEDAAARLRRLGKPIVTYCS